MRLLALLMLLVSTALAQTTPRAIASWDAVTTNSSGAPISGVTYNLYRGSQSNGSDLAKIAGPLSALTFTDTTISASTQYYYAVSAITTGGIEGAKSSVTGFKFSDLVPGTPPNLRIAMVHGQPLILTN